MDQIQFDRITKEMEAYRDKDNKPLKIHYLGVLQDDQMFLHRFNDHQDTCDIRSISKTIITFTVGIIKELSKAGQYPKFDENTYVYPIIEDVITIRDEETLEKFKKLQVKHLMTHTMGYDKVLLMRDDIKDMDPYLYLDYIVNSEIVHAPGEYYLYSNAGFYTLGAVLQHFLKQDLLSFIEEHLFSKLDFQDYTWEKYGDYLAGATRLWLRPEDLFKVGLLLLNDGMYHNQQIISKEWVDYMKVQTALTPGVDTPTSTFRRYAYASGMWIAKDRNITFGHGTDGQIVASIPDKNAVVITLSEQVDITRLEEFVDEIITELL